MQAPVSVPCCQCGNTVSLKWEPLDRLTVWCRTCIRTSGSPYASEVAP